MKLILFPLLAAITYSASILLAKFGLTRRRISIRDYIPGIFLSLAFFSWLCLPRWGHVNTSSIMQSGHMTLLISIVAIAAVWNILYYLGLGKEKVNTTEGIIILMPLTTIAISWFFDPQNFDAKIAATALIATAMVAWTFRPSKVVRFDIYGAMLLVAVLLMSLENVLVGKLLQSGSISPAALYALRTTVIFVIFYLYYRPSLLKLKLNNVAVLAVSGFVGTSAMLLRFYGLRDSGIVLTGIVLILVPVIVFGFAMFKFHEKVKPQRLIMMAALGCLIIYATAVNYSLITGK